MHKSTTQCTLYKANSENGTVTYWPKALTSWRDRDWSIACILSLSMDISITYYGNVCVYMYMNTQMCICIYTQMCVYICI